MKLLMLLLMLSSQAFALTGLKVGDKTPQIDLRTLEGKKINLESSQKKVLLFYRGAWCPYCMKQLKSVEKNILQKIKSNKAEIYVVSVDSKKVASKMKRNHKFNLNVISDPKAKVLKAFNIVNKLDDKLVEKYKNSYGIDVEADSGEKHHMVAHPAVFIVQNGKVLFADVHKNYKQRTDNQTILSELGIE